VAVIAATELAADGIGPLTIELQRAMLTAAGLIREPAAARAADQG
jgi:hypothetical protein